MATSTTYDPMDVSLSVGGTYITGFAESAVSFEKDEDNSTFKVGAQGDVLITKVNNPLASFTVTLLSTSPQVAYLDKLANSGTPVPLSFIYSGEPKESVTSTAAVVTKPANRAYGNESDDREFSIKLTNHQFI